MIALFILIIIIIEFIGIFYWMDILSYKMIKGYDTEWFRTPIDYLTDNNISIWRKILYILFIILTIPISIVIFAASIIVFIAVYLISAIRKDKDE